jgi:hypothetical protein
LIRLVLTPLPASSGLSHAGLHARLLFSTSALSPNRASNLQKIHMTFVLSM